MIAVANNLFGLSTTIANARATSIGLSSIRQGLCNAFVLSFGYGISYGQSIYQQIKNTSTISSIPGLNTGSIYDSIETQVYNVLDYNYPEQPVQNKKNLALAVNAILLSNYIYNDLDINSIVGLIGNILLNTANLVNNNQIFTQDGNGNINSPFTKDIVNQLLENDYNTVINNLSSAPKDSLTEIVNYNWFEVQNIFANPNLQIMKDVENQYYYLSGKLIYQSDASNLPDCISKNVSIITNTGIISSSYLVNQPCVDKSSYIGPATGISFYRIFNDGPFSSGDFNSQIKQEYISLDKQILLTGDYSSNSKILYSFSTGSDSGYLPITYNNVNVDANGIYNINQEYLNIPSPYNCSHTYSGTMHIGDNSLKVLCDVDVSGNCSNCRLVPMTGFKFASLQLDKDIWYDKYAYIKTNPVSTTDSILKRALNILPYSYVSELNNDSFLATTSNGFTCLGYPQMTGQNSLPSLAFFQTFDSPTFGKKPSLVMFPCIGTSNNGIGSDSDRTYEISPNMIYSGVSSISVPLGESGVSVIQFGTEIYSNFNSGDIIAKQFFGMGDYFNNQYQILESVSSNAGYIYSGYVITGSGFSQNIISYNLQFNSGILGSPVKNINFVSGYSDNNNNQYIVSKMYSQDLSGNLIPYYYLDNRILPDAFQIQENQLNVFSPLPDVLENSNLFNQISGSQQVENYLPRFASGAFSNQIETFLYPNAQIADAQYNSRNNGFPIQIQFTLNIREEAVRELYARFFITNDGSISTSPYFVNVIRPNNLDLIDLSQPTPLMNNIFTPNNNYYAKEYDFNNFDIDNSFEYAASLFMVDNNWSPKIGTIIPSGKNSSIYSSNNSPFFQGVRLTGNGTISHQWFTGTGSNDFYTFFSESPTFNGLFHNYRGLQITGYLTYTQPLFDLSSGTTYINEAIQQVFSLMVNNNQNRYGCPQGNDTCAVIESGYYRTISGFSGLIPEGVDPIYLKNMGGRSGGFNVENEGGYHPKGIIGDIWNNFSYTTYGMIGRAYYFEECVQPTRWPSVDDSLILIGSKPNLTNIYTRGLYYNPFIFNSFPFIPFNKTESYNCNLGTLNLNFSGDFATFSLNTFFPNKNINSGDWYNQNGLIIGPFDREMEIGVLSGNCLYSSSANIYFNGNQITDPSGLGGCDINTQIYGRASLDSGIFPGEYNRDERFTIIGVIPKNGYAYFNLSGLGSGLNGFNNSGSVSSITLRPRKLIGASVYDSDIHIGEENWINPFMFLYNGIEKQYTINHNGFENLSSQNFSFITYSNSGILYPQPNNDFTGLGSFDKFGNLVYPSNANVQRYWQNYAIKNNTTVVLSGWREGSRLSFEFQDIKIIYNEMPYQTHTLVIPSGKCIVTGEMGYLQQAEASIYSAGVLLTDSTTPIPNNVDEYQPVYLSDVLNRLPFFNSLSGQFNQPVLEAPSVMIQRKFVPIISGGQEYNKLLNTSPDNYNKLCWEAFSDLETLNEGETLEANMPNDTITYTNSSIIFSASQGQPLPNGMKNPIIDKTYDVTGAWQTYDSIATNAIINSGNCITENRGTQVRLQQSKNLSGVLTPLGTSLSMIKNGFN